MSAPALDRPAHEGDGQPAERRPACTWRCSHPREFENCTSDGRCAECERIRHRKHRSQTSKRRKVEQRRREREEHRLAELLWLADVPVIEQLREAPCPRCRRPMSVSPNGRLPWHEDRNRAICGFSGDFLPGFSPNLT